MNKKLNSLIMLTLMLASIFVFVSPIAHAQTPTMYLTATKTTGLTIGEKFYVEVLIKDFTDLYGWQVGLLFDKNVLEVDTTDPSGGVQYGKLSWSESIFAVLAPSRSTNPMAGTIDNANGQIYPPYAEALTGSGGVTGTAGTGYKLMKVAFKVKGYAPTGTTISFYESDPFGIVSAWTQWPNVGDLLAPAYESLTVYTEAPPAPHGPTAKFSWLPLFPTEGATVNFDASASTPGFDGTNICPITQYRWDWNGDLVFDDTTASPTITHVFATAGDYPVTLEVYAPGATPDTDRITKTVKVLPPAQGADIDLYCQRTPYNGEGPDVEADAFAPQELVILKAKVTYNGDPVANKLVAFQVNASDGSDVIYRVAFTNDEGIATVEFRIPSNPPMGMWIAWATVDVAETIVADTMPFYVGWLITIGNVVLTPSSVAKGATLTVEFDVYNWAMTTKDPTMTIVLYDACGVPIQQIAVESWDIPGRSGNPIPPSPQPFSQTFTIPLWAFISPPEGKAYINAFTALPCNNGVPYCPEASASFIILKP